MFSLSSLGLNSFNIKALVLLYSLVALILFFLAAVLYIMKTLGVYNMSETAELNNGWFSFFPFFFDVKASQLANLKNRTKKNNAFLTVHILSCVFGVLGFIACLYSFVDTVFIADKALLAGKTYDVAAVKPLIIPFVLMGIALFFKLIYVIIGYVYFYKILSNFSRQNALLITVISIVLPILIPVFLFSVRNNRISGMGGFSSEDGNDIII